MGRPLSHRAHCLGLKVIPALLSVLLVACLTVCPMGSAFAVPPSDDSATVEQTTTDQSATDSAYASEEGASGEGSGENDTESSSAATIPEAGTNTSNPIKPRPKVEITTGVVAIEQSPDASIAEEGVPLGAFDPSACVFHLWMLVGIALTIAYTFFAWSRIRKYEQSLDVASRSLVGKPLGSMETVQRKSVKASSTTANVAENAEN